MPPDEHQLALGAWSRSELQETASDLVPPGTNSFQTLEDRFRTGVAKLVQARSVRGASETVPAVFILASFDATNLHAFSREPMLDNGLQSVGGRVWIVNAPVVTGWYRDHPGRSDNDLFNFVTDELALGSYPAVVFDPRCGTLRFYPKGLTSVDECETEEANPSITLEHIVAEIHHVYARSIVTPSAQSATGGLWEDRIKWWPVERAEQAIQLYLKLGLQSAFKNCNIREEQPQVTGRIDLLIEQRLGIHPSAFIARAVLELKVLRSFGSTGGTYTQNEIKKHIREGVEQAFAYRSERSAEASALCCFDMRKTDTGDACFIPVAELASGLQVSLNRWFVYASDEAYREALTTNQTSSSRS